MNTLALKDANEQFRIASHRLDNIIEHTINIEPDSQYRKNQIIKSINEVKRKLYKIQTAL